MPIHRRTLLGRAGGALVMTLAPSSGAVRAIVPPPKARVSATEDVYFGETVRDPYRWMEDDQAPYL